MKPAIPFLPLIILLLFSCNPNTEKAKIETPADSSPEFKTQMGKHCYLKTMAHEPFVVNGDTIQFIDSTVLELKIMGEKVTGIYNWMPAEKDQAHGTIEGTIKDNIITAIYSYTIEGSDQKEEAIFKMETGKISLLSGQMEEVDGVMMIKDKAAVEISESLAEVDCK